MDRRPKKETEAEFRERMKPFMKKFQEAVDKFAAEHPDEYEAWFTEDELENEKED